MLDRPKDPVTLRFGSLTSEGEGQLDAVQWLENRDFISPEQ